MTARRFDVVVVGARCSGAATALLLARAGRRVLLADKARPGSDTLSTHALTRTGVLLLSRWGLLDELRAADTPTVTRVVQHYGDEEVAIPLAPRGDVDGLYVPRRDLLDGLLVRSAREAGAEVRHGTTVRGVLRAPDGRVTGVELTSPRGREEVSADLVVGADGRASTVARLVGARILRRASTSSATVYTYVAGLPRDAYHNWFRPGGAAGLIPTNGGLANVWASLPATALAAAPCRGRALLRHGLCRLAPELAARHAAAHSGAPHRVFPGLRGTFRQPAGAGWALVGDAGCFTDPIGAHGMTDAFVSAWLASVALAEEADTDTALRRFARDRLRVSLPLVGPIERAAAYDWDLETLRGAHLELNGAMRAEWAAVA